MASRSLSLTAYSALKRRSAIGDLPQYPDRRNGQLIWLHVGHATLDRALRDLALRMISHLGDAQIIFTAQQEYLDDLTTLKHLAKTNESMVLCPSPSEHPNSVTHFLDHWKPDVLVWFWGGLRPNLIQETQNRNIPIHLHAADSAGFDGRRDRWLPELARTVLRRFETVNAQSLAGHARLIRLGLSQKQITMTAPMLPTGQALHCQQSDIDMLASHLVGRPVWLSARTNAQELSVVLAAHRHALRNAQQLLLVLNLATEADLAKAKAIIEEEELQSACWGDGEMPGPETQVLIADLPDELGLWYRVASVSFLGSSLSTGTRCCDPMQAAALGTAILYGPNVRDHLHCYTRLASAGAARIVKDASSLGSAISQLIAPDQAASMAHAGWDVVTEGAEAVDAVMELIQDSLQDQPNDALA